MSERLKLQAEEWMRANPFAMQRFESYAQAALDSGRKRIGIALLVERVRWYFDIENPGRKFKIPNAHRAYIARELMRRNPGLAGVFQCAELRSRRVESYNDAEVDATLRMRDQAQQELNDKYFGRFGAKP